MTEGNPGSTAAEEIRLAVVLNGGVSLAVWMGGVALELDRLARRQGVYPTLLRLAGCTARVDVIAGTSAGGINGAALALAQVNPQARLMDLRDIWTEQGRLETLLRQPFTGSPTSLLRGDEYFLPQLQEALLRLSRSSPVPEDSPGHPVAAGHPVDLTITTTLLRGTQKVTVDSTGQRLPQWVHDGRFHFRGGIASGFGGSDPFAPENIMDTARQLALAARCTASFPVAFEPSFVPVDRPDNRVSTGDDARLRPDMAEVASWATRNRDEPGWISPGGEGPPPEASRFVVDGGLLANMPTRSALRGIEAMPVEDRPVRRVMVLVHPHAPDVGADPADEQATAPTTTQTVTALLGALSAQGGRTFVEQIEAHNLAAAGRRGTRSDVLRAAVEDPTRPAPEALQRLTREVYPNYRRLRMWRAGRDVARWVIRGELWNQERVRRNSVQAQEDWFAGHHFLPYVPALPPLSGASPYGTTPTGAGWGWGVSVAAGVADAAADLLRRLLWVLPPGAKHDVVAGARKRVWELRSQILACRDLTDGIWRTDPVLRELAPTKELFTLRLAWYRWAMLGDDAGLRDQIQGGIEAVARYEAQEAARADDRARGGEARRIEVRDRLGALLLSEGPGLPGAAPPVLKPAQAGVKVRLLVREVITTLLPPVAVLHQVCAGEVGPLVTEALAELRHWDAITVKPRGAGWESHLLDRLVALEVATTALGDEVTTESTGSVELVQLSAQVNNGFSPTPHTADDKLGGMALNRFGGFLKRSWRINDWMWGRLDAATVLCRLVLDPTRVRRAAALREELTADKDQARQAAGTFIEDLLGLLVGPSGSAHPTAVDVVDPAIGALIEPAVEELAGVLDSSTPVDNLPPTLRNLAQLAAWAIHLQVAAEELPALARGIRADRLEGANPRSNSERLLAELNAAAGGGTDLITRLEGLAKAPGEPVPPEGRRDAVVGLLAFDRARIGQESLSEEGTSDQMLRTATTAAAVAVTTLDSDRAGLPTAAKAVTRTLRGGMLLPYWVVTGLTAGGALARALALLGLAIGAVLLALALFGALPGWAASLGAAFGVSAVLLGLGYGALRSRTLLHGLVLLSPVIPLLAFAASRSPADTEGSEQAGLATLIAAVGLAVGLMILGSLPAPMGSVFAELDRLADRHDVKRVSQATTGSRRSLAQAWRRARGVARVVGPPALGVLVLVLVVAATLWLVRSDRLARLTESLTGQSLAVVIAGVLALTVLGGIRAFRAGLSLRRVRIDPASGVAAAAPVAHPTGVVLGWSVLYGTGYLALAAIMLWNPWDWKWQATVWGGAVFASAVVFALTLVVLVPVVAPWRAKRRIVTRLTKELAGRSPGPPPEVAAALNLTRKRGRRLANSLGRDEQTLIAELVARDEAFLFLVQTPRTGNAAPAGDPA